MSNFPDFFDADRGLPYCAKVEDPEIFFPEPYGLGSGAISKEAKKVCNSGCPYVAECLQWALDNKEPGVWGGTSEIDRARMRREAVNKRYRPVELSKAAAARDSARSLP